MNNDLVKFGKAILKANVAVAAARDALVKKQMNVPAGERLSRSDYRLLGVAKKIETLAETVRVVFDSEV